MTRTTTSSAVTITGRTIRRVYIQSTGGIYNSQWRRFFAGSSGFTPSRREALLAVEEAYHAGLLQLAEKSGCEEGCQQEAGYAHAK